MYAIMGVQFLYLVYLVMVCPLVSEVLRYLIASEYLSLVFSYFSFLYCGFIVNQKLLQKIGSLQLLFFLIIIGAMTVKMTYTMSRQIWRSLKSLYHRLQRWREKKESKDVEEVKPK